MRHFDLHHRRRFHGLLYQPEEHNRQFVRSWLAHHDR